LRTRSAEIPRSRRCFFGARTIEDQSAAELNVDHSVRATLFWRGSKPEAERIEKVLVPFSPEGLADRWREAVARPEAVARYLACCWRRPQAAAGRRRAGRAGIDRRRNPSNRRTPEGDHKTRPYGRRARHDLRARARRQGDMPATKARCWRKGPSTSFVDDERVVRSVVGKIGANAERRHHQPLLWRGSGASRRLDHGRAGQGDVRARPQTRAVRQDLAAARDGRPVIRCLRRDQRSNGEDPSPQHRLRPMSARAGHRLRAAGPRLSFPLADGGRESQRTSSGPLKRETAIFPMTFFSLFPSGAQLDAPARGGGLSGGQQQHLSIGRALVMRAKAVCLLDEPDRGHPPLDQQGHRRAISYFAQSRQHAIGLVRTILDFACELGDTFAVMDPRRGHIPAPRGLDPAEISRRWRYNLGRAHPPAMATGSGPTSRRRRFSDFAATCRARANSACACRTASHRRGDPA